jgi:hypothetical protein
MARATWLYDSLNHLMFERTQHCSLCTVIAVQRTSRHTLIRRVTPRAPLSHPCNRRNPRFAETAKSGTAAYAKRLRPDKAAPHSKALRAKSAQSVVQDYHFVIPSSFVISASSLLKYI